MKPNKMLGLAALAALMTMAFVGASSASASSTLLCSTDPATSCTAVSHVHETSVGKMKLLSNPTVECNVLFLGDALGLASPLIIHGTFSYSNCNNSCTVAEENGPGLISVLKTASELAAVLIETLLVKLTCFFGFIGCRFSGSGIRGHGLGPLTSSQLNGSVVITGEEVFFDLGSCPPEAFLDITTTPLSHTYIGS